MEQLVDRIQAWFISELALRFQGSRLPYIIDRLSGIEFPALKALHLKDVDLTTIECLHKVRAPELQTLDLRTINSIQETTKSLICAC